MEVLCRDIIVYITFIDDDGVNYMMGGTNRLQMMEERSTAVHGLEMGNILFLNMHGVGNNAALFDKQEVQGVLGTSVTNRS